MSKTPQQLLIEPDQIALLDRLDKRCRQLDHIARTSLEAVNAARAEYNTALQNLHTIKDVDMEQYGVYVPERRFLTKVEIAQRIQAKAEAEAAERARVAEALAPKPEPVAPAEPEVQP